MTTIKIPGEDGTSLPAYLARPATAPGIHRRNRGARALGVKPDIRGVADDLAGYAAFQPGCPG